MKTLFTTVIAAAALAMVSVGAYAKDCNAYAQAAVDAQTHPLGSAAVGCGVGLALGTIFGKGKNAQIGGCAAGAGTGVVLSAAKAKTIYDNAYAQCINGGGGNYVSAPSYSTFPPPSSSANTPYSTSVNVRNGPGTQFGVREHLPPNTTVTVAVCSNNGWCQIGGYTGPGWVSQSLLNFN